MAEHMATAEVHYALSIIFGYSAVVCFALVYMPQVILNYQLKSTEGFSLALSMLWHVGACFTLGNFIYEEVDLPLIIQFAVFLLFSIVLLCQFFYYYDLDPIDLPRHGLNSSDETSSSSGSSTTKTTGLKTQRTTTLTQEQIANLKETRHRYKRREKYHAKLKRSKSHYENLKRNKILRTVIGAISSTGLTLLIVYVTVILMDKYPSWAPAVFGSVFASILFAVGFLPQLYLFFIQKHSNGFSLFLSALDISGCSCSIASQVLLNQAIEAAPEKYAAFNMTNLKHMIPLITIIACQVVTVTMALFIYPPTAAVDSKRMKDYVVKGFGACCLRLGYKCCDYEENEDEDEDEDGRDVVKELKGGDTETNSIEITIVHSYERKSKEKEGILDNVESGNVREVGDFSRDIDQMQVVLGSHHTSSTGNSNPSEQDHNKSKENSEIPPSSLIATSMEVAIKLSNDYFQEEKNHSKDCVEMVIHKKKKTNTIQQNI